MAFRGTSEIVFGTLYGTFWNHSGRFLGGGGGGGEWCTVDPLGSLTMRNGLWRLVKNRPGSVNGEMVITR